MGEFFLRVVPNYIDLRVSHFPDTLQDIGVPSTIQKPIEYLDYGAENATI